MLHLRRHRDRPQAGVPGLPWDGEASAALRSKLSLLPWEPIPGSRLARGLRRARVRVGPHWFDTRWHYLWLQLHPQYDDNWWPARGKRWGMRFRAFVGTLFGRIRPGCGIYAHVTRDAEGKPDWLAPSPTEFQLCTWGWEKWSYIQLVAADVWGTQYDFNYMTACEGWRNWHIHVDQTSTC